MLKANLDIPSQESAVEVIPYDPTWTVLFDQEAALIGAALGQNCVAIHHVGSTSVPGLAAKPIIDIVPVVKDILQVDTNALKALGYLNRGELGMLFRRFFTKGVSKRTHHLHIWEDGNPEIDKQLLFRAYLMDNPEELKRYEDLKLNLAIKYSKDRKAYTFAKDDLICEMLQKAGFQGLTMVQALTTREWERVKYFRQHYFFRLLNIEDPYTKTFTDPSHFHIVLRKGVTIMGYAHLQFWPDARAALRIIVLEESFRNQCIGHKFLQSLERWLSHHEIKSLHIQSSSETYNFYKQNGYIEMPFRDPEGHEANPKQIDMGKILNYLHYNKYCDNQ